MVTKSRIISRKYVQSNAENKDWSNILKLYANILSHIRLERINKSVFLNEQSSKTYPVLSSS